MTPVADEKARLERELVELRAAGLVLVKDCDRFQAEGVALEADRDRLRAALEEARSIAEDVRGYGEHPEQFADIRRVCDAALTPPTAAKQAECLPQCLVQHGHHERCPNAALSPDNTKE
jgi:hypothetical protein